MTISWPHIMEYKCINVTLKNVSLEASPMKCSYAMQYYYHDHGGGSTRPEVSNIIK